MRLRPALCRHVSFCLFSSLVRVCPIPRRLARPCSLSRVCDERAARALDISAPPNAGGPSRNIAKKNSKRRRKTMPENEKQDVYTRITNKIIASLEQGVRPWIQPWNAEHVAGKITRPLRHNGQAYSGINILMLWASAMEQGFTAPIWMTFKQALELDAHVRKGEKGSLVVYANAITRTEHDDATGEDIEREIPFLKGYTVFNVEQIEGLPDLYYAKSESKLTPVERIARAEEFFAATKAVINYGGNRAYYAAGPDRIQMP